MLGHFRRYSNKAKDLEDAFTQRLKQLEEQYDESKSLDFKSLIDKDPKLSKLSSELETKRVQYQLQQFSQNNKVPTYAGKQSHDIALSQPWTGTESKIDSNLRMLVDKHKPSKVRSDVKKLARAKEAVLDFTLDKNSTKVSAADAKFKEIYKEKFTPIGSFDKIKTIADARIEEAMRRGDFNNIDRTQKTNSEIGVYVERTEHHLNNILKSQNIVPPWIEKQGGVNGEIRAFREALMKKWELHIRLFHHRDVEEMKREFEKRVDTEYEHKIKMLNSSIRTYNLQAPLSTQKFYLLKDKEIQRCFDSVDVAKVKEKERKEKIAKDNTDSEVVTPGFSLKFWKW